MTQFKYLPASAADFDEIYMMGYDVWAEGASVEAYLADCRNSPKYKTGSWYKLVSESGDMLASMIVYPMEQIAGRSVCGFGSVATHKAQRRKGYAHTMLELANSDCQNYDAIFLYSDINPEYYEKLNFVSLPDSLQAYPESVCMVKTQDASLADELLQDPSALPTYF
jgi:N-acetylglutamate synthase-like GNAT family acetyltransferase